MIYRLFFKRVSRARKDLQDNSKWPSPCNSNHPHLDWHILRSGPGWLLILEERKPEYVGRFDLPLRGMYHV